MPENLNSMNPSHVFDRLTVCLDMAGCPNRCLHCWLGHGPNGRFSTEDLAWTARQFRPFARSLEVFSWYREPDFRADYRALWELERSLSDAKTPHFELMSTWRAARDADYIPWLEGLGVRAVQLTFFGGRAVTDRYTGRIGAYDEMVSLIEPLRRHGILPRFQVFMNQENIDQMGEIVQLARRTGLADEPAFRAFVHAGSCDGANEALYPIRVTPEDVQRLPEPLVLWTDEHLKRPISEVFGRTEAEWMKRLLDDSRPIGSPLEGPAVLYVDADWDVYPNVTAPRPAWRLGNLRADGAQTVLRRYREQDTPALRICREMPVNQLAAACGDANSQRLFTRGDFLIYLVNRCVRGRNFY